MQPDDVNGVALILLVVITAIVILRFGKLPQKKISFLLRFLFFIPVCIIADLMISMPFLYSCDDSGNGPFNQGHIPALCIMLIIVFVPQFTLIASPILIFLGCMLAAQFSSLVNKTGDYTYSNTYTGKPVNQACSADPYAVHPKAVKRWHTPLTRIYRIVH